MNMFARAGQGMNLNPAERSLLRLIKSFLLTGALAILPSLYQLEQDAFSGHFALDWQRQLVLLAVAFLVAVAHSVAKYFSAQGDAPLADAINLAADTLAKRVPTPVVPGVTVPLPTTTAAPATTTATLHVHVPADTTSAT